MPSREWARTGRSPIPAPRKVDYDLLIVWMACHVIASPASPASVVIKLDFLNPAERYWMVLEPSEVSACPRTSRVCHPPRGQCRRQHP